jgi:hypothetical protein
MLRVTGPRSQVDDGFVALGESAEDKVGADEASAAGDEHHVLAPNWLPWRKTRWAIATVFYEHTLGQSAHTASAVAITIAFSITSQTPGSHGNYSFKTLRIYFSLRLYGAMEPYQVVAMLPVQCQRLCY